MVRARYGIYTQFDASFICSQLDASHRADVFCQGRPVFLDLKLRISLARDKCPSTNPSI